MHDGCHGEYRILLDSGEKHTGAGPANYAGMPAQTPSKERREDRFSRCDRSGSPSPARVADRKLYAGARSCGTARPDAPAQETAGAPEEREKPDSEGAGNGQREDGQCGQRRLRSFRPGDSAGIAGEPSVKRRTNGRNGEETAAAEDTSTHRGSGGATDERSPPLADRAERRTCKVSGSAGGRTGEKDRSAAATVPRAV